MKILVSALEPSAQLHLNDVLTYLPDVEVVGIRSNEFAVMGIVDAVGKLYKAYKSIQSMVALAQDVDVVLLIDAPSFNLPLAKAIKKKYPHKKIIYYILPKVWAWKAYRAKQIDKYVDEAIAIFPFEERYFAHSRYFGNPLLGQIKHPKESVTTSDAIGYLPGSRKAEITRLMPLFRQLQNNIHGKRHLLSIPPFINDRDISKLYGDVRGFEIVRDSHAVMEESEFAFVCSGTATLECALIGTPFALVYIAKNIDYMIAKMVVDMKYVGLANIIFDKAGEGEFHHEFIQKDASVPKLIAEYQTIDKEGFLVKSKKLRKMLAGEGAEAIAKIIFTN